MQLVAWGAQDVKLNGDPQITFFRVVYRNLINFARESIENTYNGVFEKAMNLFGGVNDRMRYESSGAQHVFSEDSFGGNNE